MTNDIYNDGLQAQSQVTTHNDNGQNDGKHWYTSKMIWFNLLIIIASVVTSAIPALEPYLTPEIYAVLVTSIAFINSLLRLVTGKPIKRYLDE